MSSPTVDPTAPAAAGGPYAALFSPLRLGPRTARNRIMFGPHGTRLGGHDHLPTLREARYLAERARGGAGIVIFGTQRVMFNSVVGQFWDLATHPRAAERYRIMAEIIKPHGALLIAQLQHLGRQASALQTRVPLWAPSAIPDVVTREVPKEMDERDIAEVVAAHVEGARNVLAAGFDGVEVYAAQGYLLSEFLSPNTNRRTDGYGGTLENRARIVNEVTRGIREACGSDFIIGLRINGDDFTPGGISQDDVPGVAEHLAASGDVSYLHVGCATHYSRHLMIPDMTNERRGMLVPVARRIRERVSIPVAVSNQITTPDQADHIVSTGQADIVVMVRSLIADPEWPRKAREGEAERIRPCVGANVCHARVSSGADIACAHNAAVARERYLGIGTLVRSGTAKSILVVGGGPAGLEAARVAAELGHRVEIWEARGHLGGQVRIAAVPRTRRYLLPIVDWLEGEVRRLGVTVRLGIVAAAPDIVAHGADKVIVATGAYDTTTGFTPAIPDRSGLPGADQQNVYTLSDVLERRADLGRSAVLIDDESNFAAVSTAEHVAEQGTRVEIVTRFPHIGVGIYEGSFGPQHRRLAAFDIAITPNVVPMRIEGRRLILQEVYGRGESQREADTFILAMGRTAFADLGDDLRDRSCDVTTVGDCVAPRDIASAVYEAHLAARGIDGPIPAPWELVAET